MATSVLKQNLISLKDCYKIFTIWPFIKKNVYKLLSQKFESTDHSLTKILTFCILDTGDCVMTNGALTCYQRWQGWGEC